MCSENLGIMRVLLYRQRAMKKPLLQLAVLFVVCLAMMVLVSFPCREKHLSTAPDDQAAVLFKHSLLGDGALYLVSSSEQRLIAAYSPSEYSERIESIVWHTNELVVIIGNHRETRGPKKFRCPLALPVRTETNE